MRRRHCWEGEVRACRCQHRPAVSLRRIGQWLRHGSTFRQATRSTRSERLSVPDPRTTGLTHHNEPPLVPDLGERLPSPQPTRRPPNPSHWTDYAILAHGARKPTIRTQVPVAAHRQVGAMFDQHRTHLPHRGGRSQVRLGQRSAIDKDTAVANLDHLARQAHNLVDELRVRFSNRLEGDDPAPVPPEDPSNKPQPRPGNPSIRGQGPTQVPVRQSSRRSTTDRPRARSMESGWRPGNRCRRT